MNDLETFRRLLRPNKHNLDEELEIQAEVMGRISDCMAHAGARAAEAEQDLKAVEARLYQQFKSDDEKRTDKALESAIKRHQDRVRASEKSIALGRELAQWQGLYDAWRARGFSISKLCDLYVAQYFTKDSHSSKVDHRRTEETALQQRKPYVDRSQRYRESGRRRISEE